MKKANINIWLNNGISIVTEDYRYHAEFTDDLRLQGESLKCKHDEDTPEYRVLRDKLCELSKELINF